MSFYFHRFWECVAYDTMIVNKVNTHQNFADMFINISWVRGAGRSVVGYFFQIMIRFVKGNFKTGKLSRLLSIHI